MRRRPEGVSSADRPRRCGGVEGGLELGGVERKAENTDNCFGPHDNGKQMRYYKQKYPEVDELVMVQVRQIAEMGAYVKLVRGLNGDRTTR